MTDISIPNVFVAGTAEVAADVNANFDAIKTFINSTGVPKVQSASVGPAALSLVPMATATLLSGPTLASTTTDYTFTSLTISTGGMTLTSGRIVVPIAGYYRVSMYASTTAQGGSSSTLIGITDPTGTALPSTLGGGLFNAVDQGQPTVAGYKQPYTLSRIVLCSAGTAIALSGLSSGGASAPTAGPCRLDVEFICGTT